MIYWRDTVEDRLKPCPFCGEDAWLQKIYQELPEGGLSKVPQYFVQCKDGGCESMTGLCGMEETAIEVWNKRALNGDERWEKLKARLKLEGYDKPGKEELEFLSYREVLTWMAELEAAKEGE